MTHYSQIPEKPLYANPNKQLKGAKQVYFFKKPNGEIVNADEQGAWAMYAGRQQIIGTGRINYEFIGSSDGTAYHQAILESHKVFKEQGLEAAQQVIRDALEAEIEIARTNKVPPPNLDYMGDGGGELRRKLNK